MVRNVNTVGAVASKPDGDGRLALIREISALAVGEIPSARAFATALERTLQILELDVVAVCAGDPLTLRMQAGGVTVRPGTAAPVGLAVLAAAERKVLVSSDLVAEQRWPAPSWASGAARSEAALPIVYRGRHIKISTRSPAVDGFDQGTLETLLETVAEPCRHHYRGELGQE